MKFSIALICFLSLVTTCYSLPVYFKALTVEDGLSNSSVLAILQDSRGFIWLGTRDGLNRYDGKRVKVYRDFYSRNLSGINVKVNCLVEDEYRNLWIGTSTGLYLYNEKKESFSLMIFGNVNAFFKDAKNNLWIGASNGLYLMQSNDGNKLRLTFIKYDGVDLQYFKNIQSITQTKSGQLLLGTNNGIFSLLKKGESYLVGRPLIMKGINIITIGIDSSQNVWMGSNKTGLYKTNTSLSQIDHYVSGTSDQNILNNNVRKIFSDKKGSLWIGTLKGLNRYNQQTGLFDSWVHEPNNSKSLNNNSIYDIYEDRQGSLWLGTYYGGANIKEARSTYFEVKVNEPNINSLSSNIISAIEETHSGKLWIGTEAEGLNLLDLKTGNIARFNTANRKLSISNLIKTIHQDHANILWVGSFAGGVNYSSNEGQHFSELTTENSKLNSNDVTSIVEDEKQRLWVGQQDYGINIISKDRKQILKFNEVFPNANLIDRGITFLYRSSMNDFYIGTRSGVFFCQYNKEDSKRIMKKIYPIQEKNSYINCIVEDSAHQIWIGSASGLCLFDRENPSYNVFTVRDGLPSNRVVGIVPDDAGNLWLSTHNGISKFNIGNKLFTNYNKFDGLPSKVFNYNSFYKDKEGKIYFGSLDGLVSFLPSEIETNSQPPNVNLVSLFVNSRKVDVDDSTEILKEPLGDCKSIKLDYDQSDVTIDYAILNFIKPQKNYSAYKLEGYNTDWVYNDQQRVVLTRLQPGTYKLFLKAANNDGEWGKPLEMIQIKVLPPLWKTWWAYCLYILTFLFSLRFFVKFYNSRQALKRELHYEHELNLQQQKLQKMKTDFFTYMSHELRTPLTLISGPAEVLTDQTTEGSLEKKLAQSIKSNSERMLTLTNNLMDLMKADSGALELHFMVSDIVDFSKSVFEKFQIQANAKEMTYQFFSTMNSLDVNFDQHYMEIVFTNLLANAIKYTPQGGIVKMKVEEIDEERVAISVCDNGAGISAEDTGKIFSDFFQAVPEIQKQQGSGVGLALCKKLVELHNGTIVFSSDTSASSDKKQTCFTVYLKM